MFVALPVGLQVFLEFALEQVGAVVLAGFAQLLDLPLHLVQALLESGVFAAMFPFLPVLAGMVGQCFGDVVESAPRFLAQMVESFLCHPCSPQVLLQLGAFLFALRRLGFDLQSRPLQFQFKAVPGQFLELFQQRLGLDLGQLGPDFVAKLLVMIGLGQAGSAAKQGGQRQSGGKGGWDLFFHEFNG